MPAAAMEAPTVEAPAVEASAMKTSTVEASSAMEVTSSVEVAASVTSAVEPTVEAASTMKTVAAKASPKVFTIIEVVSEKWAAVKSRAAIKAAEHPLQSGNSHGSARTRARGIFGEGARKMRLAEPGTQREP